MTAVDRTNFDPSHPVPMRAQRARAVCVAVFGLLIVPGIVHAGEVRMQSPNGDGGSSIVMPADSDNKSDAQRKAASPAANASDPAKVPPMVRNADEGATIRPPRWHRMLPGMLR